MRLLKGKTYTDKSDDELVKTYQASYENQLVAALFNRYLEMIFGLCLKYFKDKEKAKDATLEIYQLLQNKLRTHKVDSFKNWLYTLSKNYCLEQLRKKNTWRDKEREAAVMYSEQVFHPDDVDKEEVLTKLEECIEKLPLLQKECIDRFYYKKEPYTSICESLDINWNKVRSYIQNGRRNLKNCISDNG